jgi:hypothetical protein
VSTGPPGPLHEQENESRAHRWEENQSLCSIDREPLEETLVGAAPALASPQLGHVAKSLWWCVRRISSSVPNAATARTALASTVMSQCTYVVEAALSSTQRHASLILDVDQHNAGVVVHEQPHHALFGEDELRWRWQIHMDEHALLARHPPTRCMVHGGGSNWRHKKLSAR